MFSFFYEKDFSYCDMKRYEVFTSNPIILYKDIRIHLKVF